MGYCVGMLTIVLTSLAFAAPTKSHYLEGLEAYESGAYAHALDETQKSLDSNADNAPALLLKGYALARLGRLSEGEEVVEALVSNSELAVSEPEVYALANRYINIWGNRWHRKDLNASVGYSSADLRGPFSDHQGKSLAVELEYPLARGNLRLDVSGPSRTTDILQLSGMTVAALWVQHNPIESGLWQLDLAAGPSLWLGSSNAISGRFVEGVFPGARTAVGLSLRAWRCAGLRAEAGYSAHAGARSDLPYLTHGPDLRVMMTGYAR